MGLSAVQHFACHGFRLPFEAFADGGVEVLPHA